MSRGALNREKTENELCEHAEGGREGGGFSENIDRRMYREVIRCGNL